jgi:hypothetical protein
MNRISIAPLPCLYSVIASIAAAQTTTCRQLPTGGYERSDGFRARSLPNGGMEYSDGTRFRSLAGGGFEFDTTDRARTPTAGQSCIEDIYGRCL